MHNRPTRWTPLRRGSVIPGVLALAAGGLLAATFTRAPTTWSDAVLYASIARSRQLDGSGIPSILKEVPEAVDHVKFYGPVFFELVARSFAVFGVSIASLRIISVFGAFLCAAGAVLLAHRLGGGAHRSLWAAALVLLAPELQFFSATGTMDTLAAGLEILALAVFVSGLLRDHAGWHGSAAGLLLALAALTTPRTYPFIISFLAAAILAPGTPPAQRRALRRQLAAATAVLLIILGVWATVAHGSPIRWAKYIGFIATHEDLDVALLPGAVRYWSFLPSAVMTPLFAMTGALIAAVHLTRRSDDLSGERAAAAFALLAGGLTFVSTAAVMNLTLAFGTYVALPLFAVVVSLPFGSTAPEPDRRTVTALLVALIACDLTVAAVRSARIAATWGARDGDRIDAFVRRHVPAGSTVLGPVDYFFYAVERGGSSYRSVSPASTADWTRWVPLVEPAAVRVARPAAPRADRFLIWEERLPIPDDYACARDHVVARYVPPPSHLDRLGRLGKDVDEGYPATVLYGVPADCALAP